MKLKFNWGWGIALFFILFVIFLAFNLIFSSMQKNDLVRNDYYQEELSYQKQIDKNARTIKQGFKPVITQINGDLIIKFPKDSINSKINGNIIFYRPSNEKLDKNFIIQTDNDNTQKIDITKFQKGLWKIKIDWNLVGNEYYNEESVML